MTVKDGETTLTLGTDYEVAYSDNTNAGTAKATITGKGNYSGTVEKTFAIKATPTVTAPTANTLTCNGNEQELVTAGSTDVGKVLYSLDGTNYSEEVPKRTNAGKYTVYYKVDTDNYYYAPQTVEVTIAESYTITWKNGDETVETDNYVPNGATPEYNGNAPTKGTTAQYTYTFSGWSDGTNTYAPDALPTVSGNVTYTAQFSKTVNKYTITWKNFDGSVLKTEQVAYGETPAYTGNTPTKTATAQFSYTFTGWDTTPSAVTGNATYTAQFSETVNQYTVKWVDGDGNILETENVKYGHTPTAYNGETPTKTATAQYTYTFNGWDKEISQITGDTTYTAQFDSTVNKYTVTWKNADGTTLETDVNIPYGTTPTYDGTTPTKASTSDYTYSFSGWSPSVSAVTGDVTYTAQFTRRAKYVAPSYYSQTWTMTIKDYEYDGTAHEPVIDGNMYGDVRYTYYNADTGEELDGAPSAIGNYKVKVYADGGSNYYSRTQYATYSITDPIDENGMAKVDAFKENDTVPVSDGKIFAGWFTDETCTTAYTEDAGKAYAKFIDENILTVKAQISSGTTVNSASTSIRFITSVDSLKYQNVSFKITFNGKTIDKQMTKVYTALNANGKKISPKVFSEDSNYMEAYTLNNIPQSAFGKEFTVTPYYTTQDGTIVEGATNTFTIANMIK